MIETELKVFILRGSGVTQYLYRNDNIVKLLALALTNLVLDLSNLVTNLAKLSLG